MLSSGDNSYKYRKLTLDSLSPKSKKIVFRSSSKQSQPRIKPKKSLLKLSIDPSPSRTQQKFNRVKFPSAQSTPKHLSSNLNPPSFKSRKNSHRLLPTGSFKALNYSTSPKNSQFNPDKIEFPMKPTRVLNLLKHELTSYEQGEILKYNEIYFIGSIINKLPPNTDKENYGFDDNHTDYLLVKNDHIAYRYEILKLLGKGSFGQVCECFDHKKKEKVALKIIKNKPKFHQQAAIEVKILYTLHESDQDNTRNIIHMKNYFLFRNHICITFELISINLYDFLKLNHFRGISEGLIKAFAKQILNALEYTASLGIIHCDLKPENILLVNPKKVDVKIIDFGSSCMINEKVHSYIQSRFYRAPEVILGIPYGCSIDMWSLGCILVELFTGQPLWPGESEKDQFLFIVSFLGMPPEEVLVKASRKNLFFEGEELKFKEFKNGDVAVVGSKCLGKMLENADKSFLDFLCACFQWDPEKRLKPTEGLMHPWILGSTLRSSSVEKKRKL